MKRITVLILMTATCLTTVCLKTAAAQAGKAGTSSWSDSTRDVFVEGELDPAAQVLFSDDHKKMAVIASKLDRAVVLNTAEGTFTTMAKEAFRFASDRESATSEAEAPAQNAGTFTRLDSSTYLLSVNKKSVLVRRHPGRVGEMSEQQLWETVPVWHAAMENYKPAPETVSALKAADKDTTVTLLFGTWCPDSKNYVPKLLKTLKAAGNDHLHVLLIGIDNQFQNPLDTIQSRRVINVPTMIVEREGHELGRMVETPAADTAEKELADILAGRLQEHKGRWSRGAEIAHGAYLCRTSDSKECGTETWELYRTSDGGYLLHSRIESGELATEVFQRSDANRQPNFIEITKHRADDVTRARYNIGGDTLTARLRGNLSGAVEQTLNVPGRMIFSSPSVAAEGFNQARASDKERDRLAEFIAPQDFAATVGTLVSTDYKSLGEETFRVPAGEFRAKHFTSKPGEEISEWWTETKLGIPVRLKRGGMTYMLTSFEAASDGK